MTFRNRACHRASSTVRHCGAGMAVIPAERPGPGGMRPPGGGPTGDCPLVVRTAGARGTDATMRGAGCAQRSAAVIGDPSWFAARPGRAWPAGFPIAKPVPVQARCRGGDDRVEDRQQGPGVMAGENPPPGPGCAGSGQAGSRRPAHSGSTAGCAVVPDLARKFVTRESMAANADAGTRSVHGRRGHRTRTARPGSTATGVFQKMASGVCRTAMVLVWIAGILLMSRWAALELVLPHRSGLGPAGLGAGVS